MSEKWSLEDFFSKMDHEGGYYELFRWGMRPEDIDDVVLRELWNEFMQKAAALELIEWEIVKHLNKNGIG